MTTVTVEVENDSAGIEPDQLARQESHEDVGLAPLETRLAPLDMR